MKKFFLAIVSVVLLSLMGVAHGKTVRILSTNDMHSAIEKMPKLAAIVDSLRAIDPGLLVLSAGDNRTGNPYNDLYEPVSYPMIAFMNFIGFDASALGNHEYDSKIDGLAKMTALACPVKFMPTMISWVYVLNWNRNNTKLWLFRPPIVKSLFQFIGRQKRKPISTKHLTMLNQ